MLAAIPRPVDASLVVGTESMPEGGDVDQVGIIGMDPHAGDVLRVGQPQVGPGRTAVGRTVGAVAVGHIAPQTALAHPNVDHVGIGVGDGDCANGGAPEEAIRDIAPGGPAVVGFPDAPAARSEVEDPPAAGCPATAIPRPPR